MKKTVNKFIVVISMLMLAIIFFITGCGKKSTVTTDSKTSDNKKPVVLKLRGGDWGAPNPFLSYPRGDGMFKTNLVFDSLLEKDEKGMIPWLAEKWEVNDNGKEYIFKLRKGIKWHDGKDLTPEDVKFTFDYYKKNPPITKNLYINGKQFVDKVEVISDTQVKITVNTLNAANLQNLGVIRIIPKHIWENVKDAKKFNTKEAFIGCGPYTLESYSKEKGSYKFNAFKDYWGPKQKVQSIEFVPVSDPVLAFEKGDIDMTNITPDLLKKYENNKEYKVLRSHNFCGCRLALNMEKMPDLKDKNVRQALNYAIDKKEIVDKVTRGVGVEASASFLPIDHVWYNPNVKKYEYNPDKAKQLLNGKKVSFELLISNRKDELRIAELIKIEMAKADIDVKVKSVDMKNRDAALKTGDYQILLIQHGGWGSDADNLRELYQSKDLSSGTNITGSIPGYKNEEIDKLCIEQMKEMNKNKRKEIVYKLQGVISEEVPMIPVFNTSDIAVFRPDKYDGYMNMYDHNVIAHSKLTYLERN